MTSVATRQWRWSGAIPYPDGSYIHEWTHKNGDVMYLTSVDHLRFAKAVAPRENDYCDKFSPYDAAWHEADQLLSDYCMDSYD